MKQVKVKIETTVETMLGDKPVNYIFRSIPVHFPAAY